MATSAVQVLQQVRQRLWLSRLGRSWYWSFLVLCVALAAVVLVQRSTGLFADVVSWPLLLATPLLAIGVAALFCRMPARDVAARQVDQALRLQDLFLTWIRLQPGDAAFGPIVHAQVEQVAAKCDPKTIAPFALSQRWWTALVAPACLALLWLFAPQFDPFGQRAQAASTQARREVLVESRREVQRRLAEVKKEQEGDAEGTREDAAIDELIKTFEKMAPLLKDENLKQLLAQQKNLGQLWREQSAKKLAEALKKNAEELQQSFGDQTDRATEKEWKKQLQAGDPQGLKKELQELQKKLAELEKTDDPIAQQEQRQELQKRLEKLEQFARKMGGGEKLAEALKKAAKNLALAQQEDLAAAACDVCKEAMELGEAELEQLAEALEDLQELEEALKNVQMAKKLNEKGNLDGAQCKGCKSMSEYAELFAKMMANGDGPGEGGAFNGPGIGKGGAAPENDQVGSDFEKQKADVKLQSGKTLMTLNTKGIGERGDDPIAVKDAIKAVKQGVSEAIEQEQIPPGYVDGIQKYFDALDK